jgi:hypothetical protein
VDQATGAGKPATGGTVTAPTPEVHSTSVNVTYTLTGGTLGYLVYHNGTAEVGARHAVSGASGTWSTTAPVATGSYTVKLFGTSSGGTAIATSSAVTVT